MTIPYPALPGAAFRRATVFLLVLAASVCADEPAVYLDSGQPVEKRVEDLLSRLTLEEKISLVHADSKFTTAAIPRLGIPRRWMSDGTHGVREDIGPDTWDPQYRTDDYATCMPSSIALAATWNPELARAEGRAIGQEARKRGKDIMLGPAVNIMRTPLCGRNFEYMGEDPFLTSRIAVGYIRGEQSQDVASCIKHFAANNQENQRMTIDVEVDERALREIYLPAFHAAVKEAGVWAVMGAYNKLRGQFCSENGYLLTKVLKEEWGFKGIVISDWSATHDTAEAALNGLDLEMGTNKPYDEFYLARPYREGLQSGVYPMPGLDDKVRRSLRVLIATRVLDQNRTQGSINTHEHQIVARSIADEGIVLLKNKDHALPLDATRISSVAVIGENAARLQSYGGESSEIKAFYEITPLHGILRRAGSQLNITYSAGYGKEPASWQQLIERAVKAARAADVAIIIGGLNHDPGQDSEGWDRKDLKLPFHQDELIRQVAAANPRTIVVLIGTGVEMDAWLDQVPAVLQAWYPGMEGGNALAGILFGDVNPSGKLPCTFPKRLEDSPAHALGDYPGAGGTVRYEEGLLVGYRWFDAKNIEPLFPFGHGLSYTSFEYSDLKLVRGQDPGQPGLRAEFAIANTGNRKGAEVAQLYIHEANPGLPRPLKELKGIAKIVLEPGEKQTISIPLDQGAFSYYDPAKGGWRVDPGEYEIQIGASSRDVRLGQVFHLEEKEASDFASR